MSCFILFKVLKLPYNATCDSQNYCNDNIGLSCQSTAGACNCPITSRVNMCDCDSNYYYSYLTGQCGMKNSYLLH